MSILRTQTEKESQDFQQIGAPTTFGNFLKQLSVIEARFTKEHKPFDMPCARMDFEDKLQKLEKESERRNGFVDPKYLQQGLSGFDYESYGDTSRFTEEADDEDMTDRVIEGTRTQVVIGHTIKYRCKQRGHGISVFYPIADYEKLRANTPKLKPATQVETKTILEEE